MSNQKRMCKALAYLLLGYGIIFFGISSVQAQLITPEDFERYPDNYTLTSGDGWTSGSGGGEPSDNDIVGANARFAKVVTVTDPHGNPTKALQMHTDTYNNNMGLWWDQSIDNLGLDHTPSKVIFGFDAMMQDQAPAVPSRVLVFQKGFSFYWAINDPGDGPPGTVNLYLIGHSPASNILSPPSTVEGPTWYRFEILEDLTNNTISARYGAAGSSLGAFSAPFSPGNNQVLSDITDADFSINANDNVYYDNFSLTEVPPIIAGDFNQDGHVNAADIKVMMSALSDINGYKGSHAITSQADFLTLGDLNSDGAVTNADLQKLLNLLKSGGGTTTTVPEPSSIILLLLGSTAVVWKSLRRRVSTTV